MNQPFDNCLITPLTFANDFFSEEIMLLKDEKNEEKKKGNKLVANILYEGLQQDKPFKSEQLNTKLFERMLECIRDSSTHSTLSLPVILVIIVLIQVEPKLLTAARMATRFVDGLSGMIESAKVF